MAIDADRDYTPADVLTCDDALSLAVLGYKVRAVDMGEGTFVDYNFAGWRINHASGASSGWSARSIDYAADWHVLPDEHYDAYKRVIMERDGIVERDKAEANAKWGKPTQSPGLYVQQFGRAKRPTPDFVVPEGARVIDYGANPAEVLRQVSVGVAAEAGLGVDHASFDRAAATIAEPVSAPNVGKWGKPVECAPFTGPEADAWHKTLPPVVPTKDKWGKPT